MSGIELNSYTEKGTDLQTVFVARDAKQETLLSRAIDAVNWMSLHNRDYLRFLTILLHPKKLDFTHIQTEEQFEQETKETREKIRDVVWQQLMNTGTVPSFLEWGLEHLFHRQYLEGKGALSMVVNRVIEELEGKRPESLFSKQFFKTTLNALSVQKQKELVWLSITQGPGRFYRIPEPFKPEMFRRLYLEKPIIAFNHFSSSSISEIESMMAEILKMGPPQSIEQAKLIHHFCNVYEDRKKTVSEQWTQLWAPWKKKLVPGEPNSRL